MPYDDVSELPAKPKAADYSDGNVYRTILGSTGQGYCTIEVAFDENGRPSMRVLVGK